MYKILQNCFLIITLLIFNNFLNAQTVREKFSKIDTSNNIQLNDNKENNTASAVKKQSVVGVTTETNIPDPFSPTTQKSSNTEFKTNLTKNIIIVSDSDEEIKRINDKIEQESNLLRQKNKIDSDAFFPDLKVVATKEEYFENKTIIIENSPQKLERLERVPQDNIQSNFIDTENQNRLSLSPLKRKYLEQMAIDLEKEISSGKNTQIETFAKKKELDELKELLLLK